MQKNILLGFITGFVVGFSIGFIGGFGVGGFGVGDNVGKSFVGYIRKKEIIVYI